MIVSAVSAERIKQLESELFDARQETEKIREYCGRLCAELGRMAREKNTIDFPKDA
jgi:hypothetical protein